MKTTWLGKAQTFRFCPQTQTLPHSTPPTALKPSLLYPSPALPLHLYICQVSFLTDLCCSSDLGTLDVFLSSIHPSWLGKISPWDRKASKCFLGNTTFMIYVEFTLVYCFSNDPLNFGVSLIWSFLGVQIVPILHGAGGLFFCLINRTWNTVGHQYLFVTWVCQGTIHFYRFFYTK